MRAYSVVVLMALVASAIAADPKDDWVEYSSTEAGFKVRFPKEPIIKKGSKSSEPELTVGVPSKAAEGTAYIAYFLTRDEASPNKESEANGTVKRPLPN